MCVLYVAYVSVALWIVDIIRLMGLESKYTNSFYKLAIRKHQDLDLILCGTVLKFE